MRQEIVEKLERTLNGWLGNGFGLIGFFGLTAVILRELAAVLHIWGKPPANALPFYFLALLLIPFGCWLLVAHAPMGNSKIIRLLAGVLGLIGTYFVLMVYVTSWASEIGYYPILRMNLDNMGSNAQLANGTLGIAGILVTAIVGVLVYTFAHVSNFWSQYFNWRLDKFFKVGVDLGALKKDDEVTDVVLCVDEKTKKAVTWREEDQPTNLGVLGSVGTGKTSQVLIPVLAQFLTKSRVGITVIEPKGDLVDSVRKLAQQAGRRFVYINPEDPDTAVFNPLEGDDADLVATVNQAALSAQFGQQDPFFSKNQSVVAKNVILLLKYLRGDDCTYLDVANCLKDDKLTQDLVRELKIRLRLDAPDDDPRKMLLGYFENEYFGPNAQEIKKFTLGLRIQIDDMLSNRYFRRVVIGKSSFNMVSMIVEGNDLFINTNDGVLNNLSSMLGILFINHYQSALQKRGPIPAAGPERKKHKLSLFCADEFAGYINDSFADFIAKSRGYGGINILALQTLAQLLNVGRNSNNRAFQTAVLGQLRSMVIFGGAGFMDAKYLSDQFGKLEEEVITYQSGVNRGRLHMFIPDSANEGERRQMMEKEIFNPTEIMYLGKNRVYYRIMDGRSIQKPAIGMVDFFYRTTSNIGNVFWFDKVAFDKEVSRKLGATPRQGLFSGFSGLTVDSGPGADVLKKQGRTLQRLLGSIGVGFSKADEDLRVQELTMGEVPLVFEDRTIAAANEEVASAFDTVDIEQYVPLEAGSVRDDPPVASAPVLVQGLEGVPFDDATDRLLLNPSPKAKGGSGEQRDGLSPLNPRESVPQSADDILN